MGVWETGWRGWVGDGGAGWGWVVVVVVVGRGELRADLRRQRETNWCHWVMKKTEGKQMKAIRA